MSNNYIQILKSIKECELITDSVLRGEESFVVLLDKIDELTKFLEELKNSKNANHELIEIIEKTLEKAYQAVETSALRFLSLMRIRDKKVLEEIYKRLSKGSYINSKLMKKIERLIKDWEEELDL